LPRTNLPRSSSLSIAGAGDDYGVIMAGDEVDEAASEALCPTLRSQRTGEESFFDRGPGCARLSGGRTYAEVDRV
jgi:N-methylhydantoinase B